VVLLSKMEFFFNVLYFLYVMMILDWLLFFSGRPMIYSTYSQHEDLQYQFDFLWLSKNRCKGKRPYHFAQVSSLFCPLYICLHMHMRFKTIWFQFISMGAYSMTNTSKQPTLLARMIPAFSAWPVDTDVLRRQYLLMVFDRCYYVAVHPDDWNLQWLVFKNRGLTTNHVQEDRHWQKSSKLR